MAIATTKCQHDAHRCSSSQQAAPSPTPSSSSPLPPTASPTPSHPSPHAQHSTCSMATGNHTHACANRRVVGASMEQDKGNVRARIARLQRGGTLTWCVGGGTVRREPYRRPGLDPDCGNGTGTSTSEGEGEMQTDHKLVILLVLPKIGRGRGGGLTQSRWLALPRGRRPC